jgi:hypothetical protein
MTPSRRTTDLLPIALTGPKARVLLGADVQGPGDEAGGVEARLQLRTARRDAAQVNGDDGVDPGVQGPDSEVGNGTDPLPHTVSS